jgi:hypothetical protein
MIRGHPVIIVNEVEVPSVLQLLEVVNANDPMGFCFGPAQRGQEQSGQNGDDGDDHQQLNQSECKSRPLPNFTFNRSFQMVNNQFQLPTRLPNPDPVKPSCVGQSVIAYRYGKAGSGDGR